MATHGESWHWKHVERKANPQAHYGVIIGAECMFAGYWLADHWEDGEIPFTRRHAV